MKDIQIILIEGPVDAVHLHGEPMLDLSEGSLVVQGNEGGFATFNWDNISYYTVSPIQETQEETTNGYL